MNSTELMPKNWDEYSRWAFPRKFYPSPHIPHGTAITKKHGDNKYIIYIWNQEQHTYKNNTRPYTRQYTVFVGEFPEEKIKKHKHTTKIYLEPNLPEAIAYIESMFAER